MKSNFGYISKTLWTASIFVSTALLAGIFLWLSSFAGSVQTGKIGEVVSAVSGDSGHHTRASRPIGRIVWRWASLKTAAEETDNFPTTWAVDGHQYNIGGDGYGFENQKSKKSMILSRVTGPYDDQRYADLWDSDGKSYGLLALGDRLYAWRGTGSGMESFEQNWLYRFDLNGKLIEKKVFSPNQTGSVCPHYYNWEKITNTTSMTGSIL